MKEASQKTLLIVDDDRMMQRYFRKHLEPLGFNLLFAPTYKEAENALKEYTIDLCVLDLALPDKSGLDLLRNLRAEKRYEQLPVIVQSGFGDRMVKEVLPFEPLRIFQKPFDMKELLQTIQEAFGVAN